MYLTRPVVSKVKYLDTGRVLVAVQKSVSSVLSRDTPVLNVMVLWNVQIVVEITCLILDSEHYKKRICHSKALSWRKNILPRSTKRLSVPNNAQLSSYADKVRKWKVYLLQGLLKLRLFLLGQTVRHYLFSFLNLILKKSLLLVRNPRHQVHRKHQVPLLLYNSINSQSVNRETLNTPLV